MWLEKFPVHFLYKIKVSEVFSFLIRNSRVFFKFFGGRNKEANDKMISFCRARRILHPQGYIAIFNFQEKRVSSPNHLFKYILLDLQQNFYWTAIRFLDPRAACTRTAWLVDLPFFIPGNNRLPRNACQEGNSKIFKTFINLLRRAVKKLLQLLLYYTSSRGHFSATGRRKQFYQTSIRKRLLDIHLLRRTFGRLGNAKSSTFLKSFHTFECVFNTQWYTRYSCPKQHNYFQWPNF